MRFLDHWAPLSKKTVRVMPGLAGEHGGRGPTPLQSAIERRSSMSCWEVDITTAPRKAARRGWKAVVVKKREREAMHLHETQERGLCDDCVTGRACGS